MTESASQHFVLRQSDTETLLFFQSSPNLIGRNSKHCHLILSHRSVSKIHCALFYARNTLYISDLGSRNGVYVNRTRVRCKKLIAGDLFRIGKYEFEYLGFVRHDNSQLTKVNCTLDKPELMKIDPRLDDFAISSPSQALPDIDDVRPIEQEKIDEDNEYALAKKVITETAAPVVSAYQIPKTDHRPVKLKRKTNKVPPHEIQNRLINVDWPALTSFHNRIRSKQLLLGVFLFLLCWGLKAIWYSGISDQEIYQVIRSKLTTIQSYRDEDVPLDVWDALARKTDAECQPLISYLEKHAHAENRVKQELLWAARDCLPKAIQESRFNPSDYEKRLERHLERARQILDNRVVEAGKYDSLYPVHPPGG